MNSDEKQKEGFGSIFHWEEEQIKGSCDPRPIFRALTRASGLTEREWSQVDIIMPPWSRCGLDALAQFWFYRMVQIDLISWEEKSGDQVIMPTPEHLPFMGNIPHLRDELCCPCKAWLSLELEATADLTQWWEISNALRGLWIGPCKMLRPLWFLSLWLLALEESKLDETSSVSRQAVITPACRGE